MSAKSIIRWGGVALLILGLIAVSLAPAALAPAWLCAFVLVSMIPIGSLALLLVQGITGGRWGADLAPVLVPAARTTPLLALAILPVLILRGRVASWPLTGAAPDVTHFYLNPLFFDLRSVAAIAIWSYLAWSTSWRKPLTAGLGLTVHLVLCSLIPPDWVLTLAPGSTSAGFGLGFGIEQMFAALGFAALLAPQGTEPRANRDLAGLILTTLLGAMYFIYVQFLISWYGDIPDKVKWYAARLDGGWPALAFAAFAVGVALPFLAILNHEVRRSPRALRLVGALVLAGVTLHIGWLTAPSTGGTVLLPALLAALAIAGFLLGTARALPRVAARVRS